ncbi:hypothetical protein D9M68_275080 [compost metagenome]|jgi:hypothetical protein
MPSHILIRNDLSVDVVYDRYTCSDQFAGQNFACLIDLRDKSPHIELSLPHSAEVRVLPPVIGQ